MARQTKKTAAPSKGVVAPPSLTLPSPAESAKAPEPKKVSRDDVLSVLRKFGKGFDAEAERLLSLPDELFMLESDDARFYSKDDRFGIGNILVALRAGRPVPLDTEYGVCIYSTSASTYLLLVDMSRRIVVKERLFCLHDEPSEDDWASFKRAVKDAESLATRERTSVAIYDGILRSMKI